MNYEDNPRSIKYYVKRFFHDQADRFRGRIIIDFPAGTGTTSRIIRDIGATPRAYDLFPEFFKVDGLECRAANIREGLPEATGEADALVCQEGIEHFQDQLQALKEFNRVLKPGGVLLITTPNYSNLRAKLSYLLAESERFGSLMPPNEADSVWWKDRLTNKEIYYGHIFLIGIQKLRVLARLAGFRIGKIHLTRYKSTSIVLFPFLYPVILLTNGLTYFRNLHRKKPSEAGIKKQVYKEVFRLSIHPAILITSHLMVEFEKEMEADRVPDTLRSSRNL